MKIFMQKGKLLSMEMVILISLLFAPTHSYCEELPISVQNLIGMKLQPEKVGIKPAVIPNFIGNNGGLFFSSENLEYSLAYEPGFVDGKWPAFLITRINKDKTIEILDASSLPQELIEWESDGLQVKWIKGRFRFSEQCRSEKEDGRVIFGLVKPERGKSDCGHFSKRVARAWLIDTQSGQIKPIPTDGLQCYFLTMSEC